MPAGEVGEHAGGFGEAHVAAAAGHGVDKCLCYMGFSDADRAVEDDRFAGIQPAQRGQIAQHRTGQFRVGSEVEVFEGGLGFELGAA
ncbi:Uncharacterised protein [Mycobacterium tuberculosis]|nr:Uncharacterised protein [Mycobacterium tuberculosis]